MYSSSTFEIFKPQVLVADHQVLSQKTLVRRLGWLSCEVDVADTAEDVMVLAINLYDLILIDIELPHRRVDNIFARLREAANERTPIVGMSEYGQFMEPVCLDAGLQGFFSKPIDTPTLQTLLRRWV